jgi:hypothetical protein
MTREPYRPGNRLVTASADTEPFAAGHQSSLTLPPGMNYEATTFTADKPEGYYAAPTLELRYLVRPWPEYVGPLAGTAKLQILQQRWLITSDVAGITTQTYEWRDVPTVEES